MPTRRLRAIIVDDDETVAYVLAEMLDMSGVEVAQIAHNPGTAAEALAQSPPCDLAFIDLKLGADHQTGVDLACRVAAAGINVIAMTGMAALPDQLPGVGLLMKPFSISALQTLLSSIQELQGK